MTKREYIEYWLKSAAEDLTTLTHPIKGKRYVHALFFGHLYLEKLCKALWVKNNKENYPPKIHNLLWRCCINIMKPIFQILREELEILAAFGSHAWLKKGGYVWHFAFDKMPNISNFQGLRWQARNFTANLDLCNTTTYCLK